MATMRSCRGLAQAVGGEHKCIECNGLAFEASVARLMDEDSGDPDP